jgi:hypothetical protein
MTLKKVPRPVRQFVPADQGNSMSLCAIVSGPREFHGICQRKKANVGTKGGPGTEQIINSFCAASSVSTLLVFTLNYHSGFCPLMNQQSVCTTIM